MELIQGGKSMEKQQLEALLKEMSLEEKVGQLFQIIGYYYVEEGKNLLQGRTAA